MNEDLDIDVVDNAGAVRSKKRSNSAFYGYVVATSALDLKNEIISKLPDSLKGYLRRGLDSEWKISFEKIGSGYQKDYIYITYVDDHTQEEEHLKDRISYEEALEVMALMDKATREDSLQEKIVKNEDLELDVADQGVPSVHSKRDDRYGHHNYKIEDPDLKRRLVDANPHLGKFLDDHYVWYLIAWAKGIDDGTDYQGFLNIYEDETRYKKVHGSYSDGYRPERDLVKDIVFNSIEEDLDLDITNSVEPGHTYREGDNDYYILSQHQAALFMPEYVEYAKAHFDTHDQEFLEDSYAWSVNDPDGYFDISMIKDGYMIYVIVWDDYGVSSEQGVPIDDFKGHGWDEIVDVESIPMYLDEDLDLDQVDYTYDPSYLIKNGWLDSDQLIANGIAHEEEDRENGVKRWGIAPGKYIIKRYESFTDAYTDFVNYPFESWEYAVDLTCEDCPVLRRKNESVSEELELDLVDYSDDWIKYAIRDDVMDIDLAKELIYVGRHSYCWWMDLYHSGENEYYSGNVEEMPPEYADLEGFFEFEDAYERFDRAELKPGDVLYLMFYPDEELEKDYGDFAVLVKGIPGNIYSAVTEEPVKEDLDLEVAPYDDSWKAYHDTLDPYFCLTIYDAERLVMERGHEASWFIAYYLDGTWLSGAYHDLSDELNGFMTFDEAFMKFKETEIGEDERLVVCYHQGAEYDENDELDFGEEDYPILAKGSEETEAQLFEDVDLEVSEGPK